jgi:hypothetical protein
MEKHRVSLCGLAGVSLLVVPVLAKIVRARQKLAACTGALDGMNSQSAEQQQWQTAVS